MTILFRCDSFLIWSWFNKKKTHTHTHLIQYVITFSDKTADYVTVLSAVCGRIVVRGLKADSERFVYIYTEHGLDWCRQWQWQLYSGWRGSVGLKLTQVASQTRSEWKPLMRAHKHTHTLKHSLLCLCCVCTFDRHMGKARSSIQGLSLCSDRKQHLVTTHTNKFHPGQD